MVINHGIHTGNARHEGKRTRGWFIGSFIHSDNALIVNRNVEVKWSI